MENRLNVHWRETELKGQFTQTFNSVIIYSTYLPRVIPNWYTDKYLKECLYANSP